MMATNSTRWAFRGPVHLTSTGMAFVTTKKIASGTSTSVAFVRALEPCLSAGVKTFQLVIVIARAHNPMPWAFVEAVRRR